MFLCGGPVYVAGMTTTAINIALIMSLSPIVVLLLSRLLGLERIYVLQVLGMFPSQTVAPSASTTQIEVIFSDISSLTNIAIALLSCWTNRSQQRLARAGIGLPQLAAQACQGGVWLAAASRFRIPI